jgi:hypothetical protein
MIITVSVQPAIEAIYSNRHNMHHVPNVQYPLPEQPEVIGITARVCVYVTSTVLVRRIFCPDRIEPLLF